MGKRSAGEWADLAEEYYASGMTQRAWCEDRGINQYTFRDRLSRQRKAGATEGKESVQSTQCEEIRWVPVVEGAAPASDGIRITVDRFEIKVAQGFDEVLFAAVCRVLKTIC